MIRGYLIWQRMWKCIPARCFCFLPFHNFAPPPRDCVKRPDASVCVGRWKNCFPGLIKKGCQRLIPRLPWSLICFWGLHWLCLLSKEGTELKAVWRVSWQTTFQQLDNWGVCKFGTSMQRWTGRQEHVSGPGWRVMEQEMTPFYYVHSWIFWIWCQVIRQKNAFFFFINVWNYLIALELCLSDNVEWWPIIEGSCILLTYM